MPSSGNNELEKVVDLMVDLKTNRDNQYELMWFMVVVSILLLAASIWNALSDGTWWILCSFATAFSMAISFKVYKSYVKINRSYNKNRAAIEHLA